MTSAVEVCCKYFRNGVAGTHVPSSWSLLHQLGFQPFFLHIILTSAKRFLVFLWPTRQRLVLSLNFFQSLFGSQIFVTCESGISTYPRAPPRDNEAVFSANNLYRNSSSLGTLSSTVIGPNTYFIITDVPHDPSPAYILYCTWPLKPQPRPERALSLPSALVPSISVLGLSVMLLSLDAESIMESG